MIAAITLDDLAGELAEQYGIDRSAARDGVRVHIDEIADDSGLFDTESRTLTVAGAEVIREAFAAYYSSPYVDPQADALLSDIIAASKAARELQEQADAKYAERDALIRRAIAAGIQVAQIADAAGLHPQRVYQIRDGRR